MDIINRYKAYCLIIQLYVVPTPLVQITTSDNDTFEFDILDNDSLGNETTENGTINNLTIGDPLILQCTVTAVRGISSSVDILWTTGGRVVRRVNNIIPDVENRSAIYTDSFEISSLTAIDNGRVYQCTLAINASPQVYSSDQITLNISGMHFS